jgi:hypothetical protein
MSSIAGQAVHSRCQETGLRLAIAGAIAEGALGETLERRRREARRHRAARAQLS